MIFAAMKYFMTFEVGCFSETSFHYHGPDQKIAGRRCMLEIYVRKRSRFSRGRGCTICGVSFRLATTASVPDFWKKCLYGTIQ